MCIQNVETIFRCAEMNPCLAHPNVKPNTLKKSEWRIIFTMVRKKATMTEYPVIDLKNNRMPCKLTS